MLAYKTEAVKENKNSSLSLIISRDSFFYGIISDGSLPLLIEADSINLHHIEPFSFEKQCLEFLEKKGLTKKRFKEVHVSSCDPRFTFIHEDLFEHGIHQAYIRNIFSIRKQHKIKSRYVAGSQHWCIFTLAGFMENNILSIYPQASFSHSIMDMLVHAFKKSPQNFICIYHLDQTLLIAAIKNSSLEFANYYETHSDEDILYHVLHAYKMAKLNPDSDVLYYSGELNTSDSLFHILYDYVLSIVPLISLDRVPSQQMIFIK